MGIHQICDTYVDDLAALHPEMATRTGIAGHDDELTDYSPEGHRARADLARRALAEITKHSPENAAERVAKAVFAERLEVAVDIADAGLPEAELNGIESPIQSVRAVFDLMPTDTELDVDRIAVRMAKVPLAVDGIRASLLHAADAGRVAALRQVAKAAQQCETWAGLHGGPGFFRALVDRLNPSSPALATELDKHASSAQEAFAEFAGFLRAELGPRAPSKDAVGPDVYRLWSRYALGADVDLHEAYEWGWAEFARIEREMFDVGARIAPDAALAQVARQLDADARYRITGQPAFEAWMQRLSDEALNSLRDKHFEIPDALMRLECLIAPPGGSVGAYYTHPAEDFSRPGRMWFSVPADRTEFSTWRETTTVYHEGVPGHHLQIATGVYQRDLNRFQRILAATAGHAEGWALYAERLMADLGFLSDDGDLFGMLDAQLFRAARVIVDIGMHLELEIPGGYGFHPGQRWTPDLGLEFLLHRTVTDPDHVHDEVDRYLGWPGQAPSYKLGERVWLQARDDARARAGDAFDLKAFHRDALRLGGMGLDVLAEQLGG